MNMRGISVRELSRWKGTSTVPDATSTGWGVGVLGVGTPADARRSRRAGLQGVRGVGGGLETARRRRGGVLFCGRGQRGGGISGVFFRTVKMVPAAAILRGVWGLCISSPPSLFSVSF